MSDVHISHHSSDRALAERLASALKKSGIEAKWSAPIARADFGRLVPEAIEACKIVLVLWSRAATADDQVLEEASYSLAKGKLIAARLEDMRIPPAYSHTPAVDLVEWDGGTRHDLFAALLKLVESKMGRKPEEIRPPAPKRAAPIEPSPQTAPQNAPLASAPMPQQPFRAQPLPSNQSYQTPPSTGAAPAAHQPPRPAEEGTRQPFTITPRAPAPPSEPPATPAEPPQSQFSHKFRSMDSLPPEGIQFGAVRSTPLGPIIPDPPPDSEAPPVEYRSPPPVQSDAPAPWTRVKPTHAPQPPAPPAEPPVVHEPEPIRAEPPRPVEPPRIAVPPPPPPAQPYVPKVYVPPVESAPWQKHLDRFAPNKGEPLPTRAPPPPPESDPHWKKYIGRWEAETPPGWITAPPAPPPEPPPALTSPLAARTDPPRRPASGEVWKKRFERMLSEKSPAAPITPTPITPAPTPPPTAAPTPALRVVVQNQAKRAPEEDLRPRLEPEDKKAKAKDEQSEAPPANDLGPKMGTDDLLVALFIDQKDKPVAPPPFEVASAALEPPPRAEEHELEPVVLPKRSSRRRSALNPLTLVAAGAGALVLGAGAAAFLILRDGDSAPTRVAADTPAKIPTPLDGSTARPLPPIASPQQATAEPAVVQPGAASETAAASVTPAAAVAGPETIAPSQPPAGAVVQTVASAPPQASAVAPAPPVVTPPAPPPSGLTEAQAFAAASEANTVESYWTYLQNFRSGSNAQEAIRRRQALYAERVRTQFNSLEPDIRSVVERARRAARSGSQEASLARSLTGPSGGTVAEFAVGASLADGATYEGDWVAGVATGYGSARTRTGAQYLGAFTAGQRTGAGVLTYANGSRYEGEFANNRPTGRGVFWDAQGRRVTGAGLFQALTGN